MNAKAYLQYLQEQGTPATLAEILDGKEQRVETQQKLLHKGKTLICFTLNIPGSYKRSPLFDEGFKQGCELILQQLHWHRVPVIETLKTSSQAGQELYVLCDENAVKIKSLMVQIEEADSFGRLLDIDVLQRDGSKISRSDIGMIMRRCLICDEPAAVCGRSRKHSYEDLLLQTVRILQARFNNQFLDRVAVNSARALLYEVAATPKPGLVDRKNSGSHHDMDLLTFIDSSTVLAPYFRRFAEIGMKLADTPANEILPQLRYPGRLAEEAMNRVTGGINCHKGIIFSMGVICCAVGILHEKGRSFDVHQTLQLSKEICSSLLDDFKNIKEPHSYGEKLYVEYGIRGIRGEAADGYPSVVNTALPALNQYLAQGFSLNDAGIWTLIHLLAVTEDSNILARSDIDTLKQTQEQAKALLAQPDRNLELLSEMDKEFIKKNISPGGCADLLALTYFLYFMENEVTE